MRCLARLSSIGFAAVLSLHSMPTFSAEQRYEGRLDSGDDKLSEGKSYDELVFDAQSGQSIKFLMIMPDSTPNAMLSSQDGRLIENTTGSYSAGGYGLGTQCPFPKPDDGALSSAPATPVAICPTR